MMHGLRALEAQGFEIMEGEELTEKTHLIKGPDKNFGNALRLALMRNRHRGDGRHSTHRGGTAPNERGRHLGGAAC